MRVDSFGAESEAQLVPRKKWQRIGKMGVVIPHGHGETSFNDMSGQTKSGRMNETNEARCEVCPLSRVQAGVAVRITQLCAAPEIQERLREIGLCEDQVIKLLTSRNNFICQVCNARLAISEHLAQLIMVEPVLQPTPASPFARQDNGAFPLRLASRL